MLLEKQQEHHLPLAKRQEHHLLLEKQQEQISPLAKRQELKSAKRGSCWKAAFVESEAFGFLFC